MAQLDRTSQFISAQTFGPVLLWTNKEFASSMLFDKKREIGIEQFASPLLDNLSSLYAFLQEHRTCVETQSQNLSDAGEDIQLDYISQQYCQHVLYYSSLRRKVPEWEEFVHHPYQHEQLFMVDDCLQEMINICQGIVDQCEALLSGPQKCSASSLPEGENSHSSWLQFLLYPIDFAFATIDEDAIHAYGGEGNP